MTTRETGNLGEDAVAAYLEKNGYEILERNYTVRGGEIDIIAKKDDRLVFVEVKTRKTGSMTSGERAVDLKKRRCLVRAADRFCREYEKSHGVGGFSSCRFDVASLEIENGRLKHAKYYVAAFNADDTRYR